MEVSFRTYTAITIKTFNFLISSGNTITVTPIPTKSKNFLENKFRTLSRIQF